MTGLVDSLATRRGWTEFTQLADSLYHVIRKIDMRFGEMGNYEKSLELLYEVAINWRTAYSLAMSGYGDFDASP